MCDIKNMVGIALEINDKGTGSFLNSRSLLFLALLKSKATTPQATAPSHCWAGGLATRGAGQATREVKTQVGTPTSRCPGQTPVPTPDASAGTMLGEPWVWLWEVPRGPFGRHLSGREGNPSPWPWRGASVHVEPASPVAPQPRAAAG